MLTTAIVTETSLDEVERGLASGSCCWLSRFPSISPSLHSAARTPVTDVTLDDLRVDRDRRPVLDVRSLVVHGGRTTAVLGPNGSGKTTLLRAIAGLERSPTGRVSFGGRPVVRITISPSMFQEQVFLRQSVRRISTSNSALRRIHEQAVFASASRKQSISSDTAPAGPPSRSALGRRRTTGQPRACAVPSCTARASR